MPALEIYTKAVVDSKGMDHLKAIQTLREYMHITPEVDIVIEILHLNTPEQLRAMIEAGCNPAELYAAVTRYDDLVKRMAGVR